MILTFEDWLLNQQYRKDTIGELARVPDLQNPEIKSRMVQKLRSRATTRLKMDPPNGMKSDFITAWDRD